MASAPTLKTAGSTRYFDGSSINYNTTILQESSMTNAEKAYVGLSNKFNSNDHSVTVTPASNSLKFVGRTISTPPAGFPALVKGNFNVFINGVLVEDDAITSISQNGADVAIIFNAGLGFTVSATDEFVIEGKLT